MRVRVRVRVRTRVRVRVRVRVGLALADGGPRGTVVVGILAGAALPRRGLTSLADATRRLAARLLGLGAELG